MWGSRFAFFFKFVIEVRCICGILSRANPSSSELKGLILNQDDSKVF